MKYRSKSDLPLYTKYMKKENPDSKLKSRLSRLFRKNGPMEIESNWILRLGDDVSNVWGVCYDQKGKQLQWSYVEDGWWIRKKDNKYEYGRLYALENVNHSNRVYHGLWNDNIHKHNEKPIIVHDVNARPGVIVGWNKFEIDVMWKDDNSVSKVKFNDLNFLYIEDYKKFKRLFNG